MNETKVSIVLTEQTKIIHAVKQRLYELRGRIFRVSDLHDNMDHWIRMDTWCDEIRDIEGLL